MPGTIPQNRVDAFETDEVLSWLRMEVASAEADKVRRMVVSTVDMRVFLDAYDRIDKELQSATDLNVHPSTI